MSSRLWLTVVFAAGLADPKALSVKSLQLGLPITLHFSGISLCNMADEGSEWGRRKRLAHISLLAQYIKRYGRPGQIWFCYWEQASYAPNGVAACPVRTPAQRTTQHSRPCLLLRSKYHFHRVQLGTATVLNQPAPRNHVGLKYRIPGRLKARNIDVCGEGIYECCNKRSAAVLRLWRDHSWFTRCI